LAKKNTKIENGEEDEDSNGESRPRERKMLSPRHGSLKIGAIRTKTGQDTKGEKGKKSTAKPQRREERRDSTTGK